MPIWNIWKLLLNHIWLWFHMDHVDIYILVGDLGLKRRGSFAGDRSKEGAILAALEKAKASNKKWIRHPNYLNLWIMNPDYVAA